MCKGATEKGFQSTSYAHSSKRPVDEQDNEPRGLAIYLYGSCLMKVSPSRR